MATVTSTIHPLPFEHLEPKRFEDLIRQLAYDFRLWRKLEATGSSGSDDSFDIRGWEIAAASDVPEESEDEAGSIDGAAVAEDRLWLIQCKREKEIGPGKLTAYVEAIPTMDGAPIYGVIVAAACSISKKARDEFMALCRSRGFAECYIWSRAEIEDMLFQPKNDHILFAYFGISLTIKRRAVATRIRSRLATKRKLYRAFGTEKSFHKLVLFRDPEKENYPAFPNENATWKDLPWRVYPVVGHDPHGLKVEVKNHFAYLHDDRIQWDVADMFDNHSEAYQNPWIYAEDHEELHKKRHEHLIFQSDWSEHNRASLTVIYILEFDNIVEVDNQGDGYWDGPTIYTKIVDGKIVSERGEVTLRSHQEAEWPGDGKLMKVIHPPHTLKHLQLKDRVEMFPAAWRRPPAV